LRAYVGSGPAHCMPLEGWGRPGVTPAPIARASAGRFFQPGRATAACASARNPCRLPKVHCRSWRECTPTARRWREVAAPPSSSPRRRGPRHVSITSTFPLGHGDLGSRLRGNDVREEGSAHRNKHPSSRWRAGSTPVSARTTAARLVPSGAIAATDRAHKYQKRLLNLAWVPACAGMTLRGGERPTKRVLQGPSSRLTIT